MTESRRFPHVPLSVADLRPYLDPLLPGKRVTEMRLLTDGLCNTNYLIRLDGMEDELVLRLYMRDPSACALEAAVAAHTRDRLPVPELLHSDPSRSRVEHPYAIVRYIPGISMREALKSQRASSEEIARAAGSVLADVSRVGLPAPGRITASWGIEPWPWVESAKWDATSQFILDRLEHPRVAARLGKSRTERLRRFVAENHGCMEEIRDRVNLVHGDFNRSNIVVARKGDAWSVVGLLDWEWAHAGSSMMDLGNMLRDIGHLAPPFETWFVEGFRESGGWLPRNWKRISMYIDMTNHCEFLENREEGNDLIPFCLRWIDRTMEAWTSL